MLDDSERDPLVTRLIAALDEIELLTRLVHSMALNICIDFMPPDEQAKLTEILGSP